MAAWMFLSLALIGQTAAAGSETLREISAIRSEVAELLRADLSAASLAERAPLVKRLAQLYTEVANDSRYSKSNTLRQQKVRIATRLARVHDELQRAVQLGQQKAEYASRRTTDVSSAVSTADYALAGGSAVLDSSVQELIDVIQSTIRPTHWDVNGGPGTIRYYRPCMALVVNASSEVHEELGGLVGALRK